MDGGVAEADEDEVNLADKLSVGVFEAELVMLESFVERADADDDMDTALDFDGTREALSTDVEE